MPKGLSDKELQDANQRIQKVLSKIENIDNLNKKIREVDTNIHHFHHQANELHKSNLAHGQYSEFQYREVECRILQYVKDELQKYRGKLQQEKEQQGINHLKAQKVEVDQLFKQGIAESNEADKADNKFEKLQHALQAKELYKAPAEFYGQGSHQHNYLKGIENRLIIPLQREKQEVDAKVTQGIDFINQAGRETVAYQQLLKLEAGMPGLKAGKEFYGKHFVNNQALNVAQQGINHLKAQKAEVDNLYNEGIRLFNEAINNTILAQRLENFYKIKDLYKPGAEFYGSDAQAGKYLKDMEIKWIPELEQKKHVADDALKHINGFLLKAERILKDSILSHEEKKKAAFYLEQFENAKSKINEFFGVDWDSEIINVDKIRNNIKQVEEKHVQEIAKKIERTKDTEQVKQDVQKDVQENKVQTPNLPQAPETIENRGADSEIKEKIRKGVKNGEEYYGLGYYANIDVHLDDDSYVDSGLIDGVRVITFTIVKVIWRGVRWPVRTEETEEKEIILDRFGNQISQEQANEIRAIERAKKTASDKAEQGDYQGANNDYKNLGYSDQEAAAFAAQAALKNKNYDQAFEWLQKAGLNAEIAAIKVVQNAAQNGDQEVTDRFNQKIGNNIIEAIGNNNNDAAIQIYINLGYSEQEARQKIADIEKNIAPDIAQKKLDDHDYDSAHEWFKKGGLDEVLAAKAVADGALKQQNWDVAYGWLKKANLNEIQIVGMLANAASQVSDYVASDKWQKKIDEAIKNAVSDRKWDELVQIYKDSGNPEQLAIQKAANKALVKKDYHHAQALFAKLYGSNVKAAEEVRKWAYQWGDKEIAEKMDKIFSDLVDAKEKQKDWQAILQLYVDKGYGKQVAAEKVANLAISNNDIEEAGKLALIAAGFRAFDIEAGCVPVQHALNIFQVLAKENNNWQPLVEKAAKERVAEIAQEIEHNGRAVNGGRDIAEQDKEAHPRLSVGGEVDLENLIKNLKEANAILKRQIKNIEKELKKPEEIKEEEDDITYDDFIENMNHYSGVEEKSVEITGDTQVLHAHI